ncbi:MAG: hypothetical protein ABIW48_10710, partial [Burkholderiales bacterium]
EIVPMRTNQNRRGVLNVEYQAAFEAAIRCLFENKKSHRANGDCVALCLCRQKLADSIVDNLGMYHRTHMTKALNVNIFRALQSGDKDFRDSPNE